MRKLKQNKGITLIALVVTIVIMLILAGVSIVAIFSDNGLIERTKKSVFVSQMKKYTEDITMFISDKQIEDENYSISVGLQGQQGITTVLPNIKSDYENEVIVQNNKTYYFYTNNKKRVKWCFEAGIPVWGYNSYQDFVDKNGGDKDDGKKDDEQSNIEQPETGDKVPEASTYKKVGDVFMQTPDLSNMEKQATYYVTYDDEGNQSIYGRIDRVDAPANWYDYSSSQKRYANIVTVTGNQVAYWVWIPRYSYITNQSSKEVDARFISTSNEYKKEDGTTENLAENYKIPEAFTFGGQELAGYWMSKYEVNENGSPQLALGADINFITVNCDDIEIGNYEVYVDGIKKYTGSLPYDIKDLKANKKYDICIVKNGKMIARNQSTTKKLEIDMSHFNPEATYYVTFDENGENMQIANRIDKGDPPSNWYNYGRKQYANIVTVTNNEVAFWVWIPRYRYKMEPSQKEGLSIELVSKNVTNSQNSIYKVPEAFTFNGQELAGYWMSKYEISEVPENHEQIATGYDCNGSLTVSVNNQEKDKEYKVYIDGEVKFTGILPCSLKEIDSSKEHDVCVMKDNIPIGRKSISTKKINVDLSNLDVNNTYYVYWDDDGIEHSDIPISKPAPTNWYDYAEKKWANIVTKANGKIAYWVWIPRYEYKIDKSTNGFDINFITTDITNHEDLNHIYKVPEAFTFAGRELKGIWVSKYEVSEPD